MSRGIAKRHGRPAWENAPERLRQSQVTSPKLLHDELVPPVNWTREIVGTGLALVFFCAAVWVFAAVTGA